MLTSDVDCSMTLVVDGYQTEMRVYRRQLQVGDQTISRIDDIRRLIIFAETGYVTLDALRWCREQGICVTQYDRAGQVVLSVTAGQTDNAVIRYNQARATEVQRLRISKQLLTDKVDGQARVAKEVLHQPEIAQTILDRKQTLGWATSVTELQGYEGKAAEAYWSAWHDVRFETKGRIPLPEHWSEFRGRSTGAGAPGPLRNRMLGQAVSANRGATDPINAVLNYLYRIAETEAQHAALQYGLDPAFGLLHTTKDWRQAFALDLLEAARPTADEIALKLFAKPVPSKYFIEAPYGIVHLLPPLSTNLVKHWRDFAVIVRPLAQKISKVFFAGSLDNW